MKLIATGQSGAAATQYVDDVFSTCLYTGTGAALDIVNGIDLVGEGGMVWIKNRDTTDTHVITDTVRTAGETLTSVTTAAEVPNADTTTDFNSDGFSLGSDVIVNTSAEGYVSWTFRKAPRFFDVQTVTKSSGLDTTVDLSSLETIGMVTVKRTDSTGSWYVWHRSLTAGKLLYLEQIAAEATLGHITVSGTTLTLEDGVIADGSYVVYAYAHDPLGPSGDGSDGLIACGSYNTTSVPHAVNLGWEPQYVMIKSAKNSNTEWHIFDIMRGLVTGGVDQTLRPNNSTYETATLADAIDITATGFNINILNAETAYGTVIYMAIRRSNKPPESGTDVYNSISRVGTDSAVTVSGVGFAVDMVLYSSRFSVREKQLGSRLTGTLSQLYTSNTCGETTSDTIITGFDVMDGIKVGTNANINNSSLTYINHFFRRALGFFDVVAYTGTGVARTVAHGLGVVPEMMIVKKRSANDAWYVYVGDETDYLVLNTTAATVDLDTIWNDTAPTASVFSLGTHDDINSSAATFICYLFATLAGISKVGSYTGNGSTQTLDCSFSAGARFILIKRTDSTGDWFLFDSVRGYPAGNDPHLSLNTTAAEVTTTDDVDYAASGFIVNQNTTTNLNVTSGTYTFLAIA